MRRASQQNAEPIVQFPAVLEAELQLVQKRRSHLPAILPNLSATEEAPLRQRLTGLALSGGGIRSATFCLGLLQALHEFKLLPCFDYLSTVSGGGYVGAWWSAWLARKPAPIRLFPPPEQMELTRSLQYASEEPKARVGDSSISAAIDPIHHLRLFSNYLTPRKGLLSADTWRAVTIVCKNLLLNVLILLPVLLALILACQTYFASFANVRSANGEDHSLSWWPSASTPPVGYFSFVTSIRPDGSLRTHQHPFEDAPQRAAAAAPPLLALLVILLLGTIAWLSMVTAEAAPGSQCRLIIFFAVFVLSVAVLLFLPVGIWRAGVSPTPVPDHASGYTLFHLTLIWIGVWVVVGLLVLLFRHHLLGSLNVAGNWGQTAMWRTFADEVLSTALTALVICTLALAIAGFGPDIVDQMWNLKNAWIKTATWGGVIGSLAGALFTILKYAPSGGADRTSKVPPGPFGSWVAALAPPLILLLLALLLSDLGRALMNHLMPQGTRLLDDQWAKAVLVAALFVNLILAVFDLRFGGGIRWLVPSCAVVLGSVFLYLDYHPPAQRFYGPLVELGCVYALATWVLALGWLADPNDLSLHAFYRFRLVRAYLGASNPERRNRKRLEVSDPAPNDDLSLATLTGIPDIGGPIHLVNTTLNLLGGSDLGTAQRRAAPFLLSGLYCGCDRTGYRCTNQYMLGQMTLGMAAAISGAAVSTNMGSTSLSAAQSMLLALANVRLGFWAPTPNRARWNSPQARLWPYYLLREATSNTSDLSSYCYLTDGGHFDNTGVYSLVQRGCRFIVVADCGADPRTVFADLGNTIRRCRIDFGAEIEIDLCALRCPPAGRCGASPGPRARFVVGSVRYSPEHAKSLNWNVFDPDVDLKGEIVWIKPSLPPCPPAGAAAPLATDIAADVRQYGFEHADFPQQPTLNQWFDEAQFESYRQLGYQSGLVAQEPLGKVTQFL